MTSYVDIMISCVEIMTSYIEYHNFFTGCHKKRGIFTIEKFVKFLNDENIFTKIMTSVLGLQPTRGPY